MKEKEELRKQQQQQKILKRRNSFPLDNPKKIIDESPIQQSLSINQQILEEYNDFVKNNPTLLPKTELFDEINRLYPVINTSTNMDEKEADKKQAIFTLFNPNPDVNKFLEDPINNELNVTLTNNSETNLYYFFTKALYFTYKHSADFNTETGTLNINVIKQQLGADLHRVTVSVNNIVIPKETLEVYAQNNQSYEEVDYFNTQVIIPSADKQQTPISLNIINLIDLSCIQQNIQFISDSILETLSTFSIFQRGGDKKLDIVINSQEQYVVWNIESTFIIMSDNPAEWGKLTALLRFNFKDLSYSFKINITKFETPISLNPQVEPPFLPPRVQPDNTPQTESTMQKYSSKLSNMGKGTINYVKSNPVTVATGVGAAATLGSAVGALFLAGVLGGKTKKRLHNKRKKRKTIRKNKHRKTRKTNRKNKYRNTKRTKNSI